MLQAHQQITDETGNTFVLLPLEEYNAIFGNHLAETESLSAEEQKAIQEGLAEISKGESITAQDVAKQLGLSLTSAATQS
jgi:predicted transcriptional regulator